MHTDESAVDKTFSIIQSKLQDNQYRKLALTLIWDCLDSMAWVHQLAKLISKIKKETDLQMCLVFNSWYKSNFDTSKFAGVPIVFTNYLLVKMYVNIEIEKLCGSNKEWNSCKTTALFQTGQPERYARTFLLFLFWKFGLLKKLTYSYWIRDEETESNCKDYIHNEEKKHWPEFLSEVNNPPSDTIFYTNLSEPNKSRNVGNGIPYNVQDFENALFGIISETDFDRPNSHVTISEKTWKHMINFLPFIIVGQPKTCSTLQSLGFKTFNEYLEIPNYDDPDLPNYLETKQGIHINEIISFKGKLMFYKDFKDEAWPSVKSIEEFNNLDYDIQRDINDAYSDPLHSFDYLRLRAILYNTEKWFESISKNQSEIKRDIEHNYDHLKKLYEKEKKMLELFFKQNLFDADIVNIVHLLH